MRKGRFKLKLEPDAPENLRLTIWAHWKSRRHVSGWVDRGMKLERRKHLSKARQHWS